MDCLARSVEILHFHCAIEPFTDHAATAGRHGTRSGTARGGGRHAKEGFTSRITRSAMIKDQWTPRFPRSRKGRIQGQDQDQRVGRRSEGGGEAHKVRMFDLSAGFPAASRCHAGGADICASCIGRRESADVDCDLGRALTFFCLSWLAGEDLNLTTTNKRGKERKIGYWSGSR